MAAETARDRWIKETQMFQRIAKVPETSAEQLGRDYDDAEQWRKRRKDKREQK